MNFLPHFILFHVVCLCGRSASPLTQIFELYVSFCYNLVSVCSNCVSVSYTCFNGSARVTWCCCRYRVPLVWTWASRSQTASCRLSPFATNTLGPHPPTSSPSTTSRTAWLLAAGCAPTSWSWRVSEHLPHTHSQNLKLICSSMSLLSQSALKCPSIISS